MIPFDINHKEGKKEIMTCKMSWERDPANEAESVRLRQFSSPLNPESFSDLRLIPLPNPTGNFCPFNWLMKTGSRRRPRYNDSA